MHTRRRAARHRRGRGDAGASRRAGARAGPEAAEPGDGLLGFFSPRAPPLSPLRLSRLPRRSRGYAPDPQQPVFHAGPRRRPRRPRSRRAPRPRPICRRSWRSTTTSSPPRPRSIATSRRRWRSARRGSRRAGRRAFRCSSPSAAARCWALPPTASCAAPFPAIATRSSIACMSRRARAAWASARR